MGLARNWTKEEEGYLCEAWGTASMDTLCKRLNRSENAILIRVHKLGLGAFTESGTYITFHQLLLTVFNLEKAQSYAWVRETWQKNGLKMRQKKINHSRVWIVNIEDFWDFAEKNRHRIDFSEMEKFALGAEPSWLDEQRHLDAISHINNATQSKWTPYELNILKFYAESGKHSVNELAKLIGRSEGSVARKCMDLSLDVKIRKNKCKGFSEKDLTLIAQEILRGNHYAAIAEQLGRSEKSIRGALYQRLGTESPDKVRKLLQCGAKLPVKPRIPPKK